MKYRVTIEDKVYEVEIEDIQTCPVIVKVDGEVIEVQPEGVESPPPEAPVRVVPTTAPTTAQNKAAASQKPVLPAAGSKAVTAPIPGTIVGISVQAGSQVEVGQELCMLEAMKMKNSIRSNRVGTVAAVLVNVGDAVRHGQILVEFSE